MNRGVLPRTAAAWLAACAAFAFHAAGAVDAPANGRSDNREIHDDRSITPVDPASRNYQRPMTPAQKQQQAAYDASRRCYARFATRGGGLKPGAEKTCGPALKDPSASQ